MNFNLVLQGIFSALFIASVLRISTALVLPALGGLITDLAGSINISLEGTMLVSAFTGVIVSGFSHNVWLGVLGGILSGILFSALLAYFHLYLGTNIILAGTALNILASGGTVFLLFMLTGDKGSSSTLASGVVPTVNIPFIQDIPFLGTVLSGHNIFVYGAFLLTFLINKLLYNTKFGVHLRAVGEDSVAATSVGINARRIKFMAILISGFLASLGGLNLSMAYLSSFQRDMTAGRGFIALAAVYLGGRKPWGTVLAAILFGIADALSNQLGTLNIPSQLVQAIPYAITILALVVNGIRTRSQLIEQTKRFQERELSRANTEEQK